jgi:1-acyl-sn-glycerol-3-phosphate acyltransferase
MIAGTVATLARLVTTPDVRWVGCQPEPRQRVYFANHTSHLDFLVLWSSLPAGLRRRTRPVAARDYWRGGLRHRLARLFNAVLIERCATGPRGAVAAMLAALDTTDSLILFPEGTRGQEDSIGRFHGGLHILARRRPDVELIPVHLQNVGRALPKGAWLPLPLITSVSFGPPLRLQEGEPRAVFLDRARAAVIGLQR